MDPNRLTCLIGHGNRSLTSKINSPLPSRSSAAARLLARSHVHASIVGVLSMHLHTYCDWPVPQPVPGGLAAHGCGGPALWRRMSCGGVLRGAIQVLSLRAV